MPPKPEPVPYVYQPYPCWRYGPQGKSVIVHDATEEAALGPGWYDSPTKVPSGSVSAAPAAAAIATSHRSDGGTPSNPECERSHSEGIVCDGCGLPFTPKRVPRQKLDRPPRPVDLELPILARILGLSNVAERECLAYADSRMTNVLLTLLRLAVMVAKLCGPGGVRAVIAENLLLKQQLLVLRRGRRRAPSLTLSDRILCGFESLFLSRGRVGKVAIALRPLTLLRFHQALVRRKYRRLFSSTPCPKKPGPKGPDEALIQAIVELKSRNPRFGCPRIALIVSRTFGIDIDKNIVYRVLAKHYRPAPGGTGPSWLSFMGHSADSLWSVDLFRCESIVLRSYWVLVVMDQFTRRLVGFGVHCGAAVTGADVCRMFNAAIYGHGVPRYLSTDHDPVFEAHR
jgi:putative transposase